MKSKHLFFAVACASALASCTNDELIENVAVQKGEFKRAEIENVSIKTSADEQTRVVYGSTGYSWEDGDNMAALLMDENNPGIGSATFPYAWEQLSWNEKFQLVDYVHTNFKFAFDKANDVWKATGELNMLEGNYFLVSPFCDFNGNRQAYYEIATQTQVGNTKEARTEAYAKNQIFVGYGRLQAGSPDANMMETKMAAVLSPIRINIKGNIVNPVEVKKIVLRHSSFASQLTIDPTRAPYGVWNLGGGDRAYYYDNESDIFNYANYLTTTTVEDVKSELYYNYRFGSELAEDYVYNAGDAVGNVSDKWDIRMKDYKNDTRTPGKYYWDDAIRAVAQPLWEFNDSENRTGYIEVYTKDSEDATGMVLSKDNELGIIAMIPVWNGGYFAGEDNSIMMEIHTNKGVVVNIDLSQQDNPETGVETVGSIKFAHPNVPLADKTVTVILDNDDINTVASYLNINTQDDLANMIEWAGQYPTTQPLNAFVHNSIVIDDLLAAKIKALMAKNNSLLTLTSVGETGNNIKFATTDAQADILEYIELMGEYTVAEVVNGGVIDLTEEAHNFLHGKGAVKPITIQVNKGGVLNIEDNNTSVDGWGVQGEINVYYDVTINNEGQVNATAQNIAGIFMVNKGIVNVTGSINFAKNDNDDNSVNLIQGTINVAKGATMTGTTDENLDNLGLINNSGSIYNVNNYKALADGIKPGTIDIKDGDAVTKLANNTGKVIYSVLTTNNYVQIKNGLEEEAIFVYIYDGTGTVNESTLTSAHVTDLTLAKGATLKDDSKETSNLKHITLVDGAKIIKDTTKGDGILSFAGVSGQFIDMTNTTINGVSLPEDVYVTVNKSATWEGTFSFANNVYLNAARVTVKTGADVTAGNIDVVNGKTSWIENHGKLTADWYEASYIQVSDNEITL